MSNIIIDNNTRTLYGAAVQAALAINSPLTVPEFSTLNKKHSIAQNEVLASDDRPTIRYMAIGNKGHETILVSGVESIANFKHDITDAALYNQMPFVLRLPNNDLTPQERAKYRFRKLITINGTTYVAYYLKVVDLSAAIVRMEIRDPVNGTSLFVPNSDNLSPVPVQLTNSGVNSADQVYGAVVAPITVGMDATDVEEYLNVCNIVHGSILTSIISEIALCSGVDRVASAEINGVSTTYAEAIAVQCCTFLGTGFLAYQYAVGFTTTMSYGSINPLLRL